MNTQNIRVPILGLVLVFGALTGVTGSVGPAAADQLTFREGASYTGTQDTYIESNSANTSFGSAGVVRLDASPVRQGLIRFDNLIGNGPNQVPAGATINSATLTIEISNRSNSSATLSMHRMLVTWSESSTWNSLNNGIQRDDIEASIAADATFGNLGSTGSRTITGLGPAVQAWANGSPNFGWALFIDSNNGLDFLSSESSSTTLRPTLVVDFTAGDGPPYVVSAIPDTLIFEGAPAVPKYRDLNEVFFDNQDGTGLLFAEFSNSAPGLVTTTFDADSALGLVFTPGQSGSATIVIRAFDSGFQFADDTFTVTVVPASEVPMVVNAIADTSVTEDSPPVDNYRDLNDVFSDNQDGSALTFTVESVSDPVLLSVAIDADSALDLSFTPDDTGLSIVVVRATDSNGWWVEETFEVMVTAVAAGLRDGRVPGATHLFQNRPNPFNPTTRIDYEVAVAGPVELSVFDVNGRHVKTLVSGPRGAGAGSAVWDGRDAAGGEVASGVYFYRLRASGAQTTRKMILLK